MIKYICIATEMKLYLPYLQKMIPELVILGMNTKWEGFITKYKLLLAYLNNSDNDNKIKDDDIICFIDAYDVLPTKRINELEETYKAFETAHPQVRIIVGYDKVDNVFHEYLSKNIFGTIGDDDTRLNSGQFIGRSKNIKHIINYILENTIEFKTDQIELTKYTNQFKDDIYIDKEQIMFYVKSKPLQQVTMYHTRKSSFIHANGNGFLETFLEEEHGIKVSRKELYNNYMNNIQGCFKKLVLYDMIFINNIMTGINEIIIEYIKKIIEEFNGLYKRMLYRNIQL